MTKSIWSEIVEQCLKKTDSQWPQKISSDRPTPEGKAPNGVSGIIYSGNIHETVPKRLLLDNRLTPIERNAWQVFKLLLDKEGFAVPHYEDLQPYLSMVPYGEKASKETIARTIHILRLTRWLSLVSRGRDKRTGQHLGSLYILHDEPITVADAVEIDKTYIELVVNSRKHANKSVRIVADGAMDDLQSSEHEGVQTRLALMAERISLQSLSKANAMHQYQTSSSESKPSKNSRVRNQNNPSSESEISKNHPVRINNLPSSESELKLKSRNSNEVRIPNPYSTSTVFINNSTSTVLDKKYLAEITTQQQKNINELINQIQPDITPLVIQEFNQRCAEGNIKSPVKYLFGLLKRAVNNEFKPWVAKTEEKPITQQPVKPSIQPLNIYRRDINQPIPESTKQQISNLKNLLSMSSVKK